MIGSTNCPISGSVVIRDRAKRGVREDLVDRTIEPRLNQIFVPLLSIIDDPSAIDDLRELARKYNREMIADRGMETEAQILEIIRNMLHSPFETRLSMTDITSWMMDRHSMDYERKITSKWIGNIIRKKLNLRLQKSDGLLSIPLSEKPKLERLFERYGIRADKVAEERADPSLYVPSRVILNCRQDSPAVTSLLDA